MERQPLAAADALAAELDASRKLACPAGAVCWYNEDATTITTAKTTAPASAASATELTGAVSPWSLDAPLFCENPSMPCTDWFSVADAADPAAIRASLKSRYRFPS